jgi:antitoxin MazE
MNTFTTSVAKWDDSFIVKIPENILQSAHLSLDDLVTCTVKNGAIVLTPKRQRYTLEELLEDTTEFEDEVDWGAPVGEEVW